MAAIFEIVKAQKFPYSCKRGGFFSYDFEVFAWLSPDLLFDRAPSDPGDPLPVPDRDPFFDEKVAALAAVHDAFLTAAKPIGPLLQNMRAEIPKEEKREAVWFDGRKRAAKSLSLDDVRTVQGWLEDVKKNWPGPDGLNRS